MQGREWVRWLGLGALAVFALLLRRNPRSLRALLRPGGWRALTDSLLTSWQRWGRWILLALAIVGVVALFIALGRAGRKRRAAQRLRDRVAAGPTVLLLPRADWKPVQPDRVQVWARLADSLPHDEHIAFEIAGNQDGLAFSLHGSEDGVRAALTQFKAEWPGLFRKPVQAEDDPACLPEGWQVWWVELAPASFEQAVQAVSDDPLRAVFIEINGVLGQGRALVQVIARRNFGARKQLGQRAFAARDDQSPSKGVRALRSQEAKEFEARARMDFLDVTLRVAGLADTRERAQGIARGLARAVAASFGGTNPVQPVRQGADPRPLLRREPGRMTPWTAGDLAALAHLPGSDLMQLAPRLQTAPARYLPADPEMRFDPARYRTAFLGGG